MIQALQITPEVLTSNIDNINFDTVDLRGRNANCCGWLQYNPGGSDFTIIGGGLFEVSFNANITSETAGQVAIELKTGTGTDVEGTESDAIIATAGEYTNVSFTKLLRICPRVNTTIAVGSLPAIGGVTPAVATEIPTIKDANLIIQKGCIVVDNLSLVLQILSLEILFRDFNNSDLMNELQSQDEKYLKKIVKQNDEIISLLKREEVNNG